MTRAANAERIPTFVTLGPEGTDHERVTERFIRFQGLEVAKLELVEDIIGEGPERVLHGDNKFLVLCSAHTKFHLVNERYPQQVTTIATFLDATRHLSILKRSGVKQPRTLALVEATHGYTDLDAWRANGTEIVDAQSKPVIARMLLAGECDAGLTFTYVADENPGQFEKIKEIGEIDTSWTVFGDHELSPRDGNVIGIRQPELFTGGSVSAR